MIHFICHYILFCSFSTAERDSEVQARAATGAQTRAAWLQRVAGDDRVGAEFHLPTTTARHPNQTDLQAALLPERQSTAHCEMVQGQGGIVQVQLSHEQRRRRRLNGDSRLQTGGQRQISLCGHQQARQGRN